MNPHDLCLESNVREMEGIADTELFQAFLASVTELGVLAPVEYWVEDSKKMVMDGFRRVIAARMAGIKDIPTVRIKKPTEQQRLVHQLVSGVQRSALSAIDIARGIAALKNKHATNDAIGKWFGKSPSWVSQHAQLLNLIPQLQKMVPQMGYRTAYEASTLDIDDQGKWLSAISAVKTVREMKRLKKTIAHANKMERPTEIVQTKDVGPPEKIEVEPVLDEDFVRCLRLTEMAISNIKSAKRTAEEAELDIGDMLKSVAKELKQ